jgi:hypothetical protein
MRVALDCHVTPTPSGFLAKTGEVDFGLRWKIPEGFSFLDNLK